MIREISPRQIAKAIEDLLDENEQLKNDYNKVVHEATEFESKVYELQDRINKAITNIDILQEIIYQQPTDNQVDDFWLLDRLDGIKNALKGDNNGD